jgi:isoleucyl-tRNA synthetase
MRLLGLARELINRIQNSRKAGGLEVTDRIHLFVSGDKEIEEAAEKMSTFIMSETLSVSLKATGIGSDVDFVQDWEFDGFTFRLGIKKA